jgi:phosphopantothenoylcysteine synthetase/decarboxylase
MLASITAQGTRNHKAPKLATLTEPAASRMAKPIVLARLVSWATAVHSDAPSTMVLPVEVKVNATSSRELLNASASKVSWVINANMSALEEPRIRCVGAKESVW